jgi:hypothetical protein
VPTLDRAQAGRAQPATSPWRVEGARALGRVATLKRAAVGWTRDPADARDRVDLVPA